MLAKSGTLPRQASYEGAAALISCTLTLFPGCSPIKLACLKMGTEAWSSDGDLEISARPKCQLARGWDFDRRQAAPVVQAHPSSCSGIRPSDFELGRREESVASGQHEPKAKIQHAVDRAPSRASAFGPHRDILTVR